MRKFYKNVFSVFTLTVAAALVNTTNAQYGCGSAVVLSNGYTASGITTPGTGGAEDWNTNPTGTSINSSYWDDDVYLFEYTATAPTENISMTIFTRNTWTGIGIFDDCSGTTFSNELDATGGSSSSSISLTVSATISAGNTVYIALGQWGTPNDLDFDVTDFTATAITCPDPTSLTASNITGSSADLQWTENGSATSWNIEYGATPFTATGTATVSGVTDGGNGSPYSLTGLSANTTYEYYVQADCGGGDLSSWAGPYSFTTPCGTYTPAYSEDFTTYVPSCWSEQQGTLTSNATLTGTSSNWTNDGFGNNGTTGAARINIYGSSSSNDEWLISPSVDLGTGNNYQLDFDVAFTAFSGTSAATMDADDSLVLVISLDNGATWSKNNILQVWTAGSEPSNTGDHIIKDLSSYSGTVKFGFYATSTVSGVDNNAYIDNFMVDVTPACAAPSSLSVTNLTATSTEFNWTENGSATEWEVVYGATGFTPMASGTSTTNNPEPSGTLAPSTDYEFYVRAICGAGDTSAWVGPYAFSTPCLSASIPWTEDFEGLSSFGTSTFPDCWFKENGTWQTSDNATSTYDANALSGQYFLRNRYGNTNSFIWTAGFDLTAGESYDFTFWWAGDGYSGWGGDVFVNTDQTSTGATQIGGSFVTSGETTSMTYQQELYRFQAPTTGTYYFAIRINSNYTPWDISFDDFGLDVTPPCPDPSNLVATWVDNDSVVVTWTEGYLETDWNIELGLPGFTPGTGSEIYSGTASTDATDTIGGLAQLTDYEVYVQADCGGGDISTWVGPLSFTTTPNCASPTMFTASSINADSVELSWTAGGAETEWAIEYGPSGFTPGMGSGTIVSVSGNATDTITGLGLSQVYDFYLVGLCSPTDSSLWVGPATVTMPLGNDDACDAFQLPVDGIGRTYTNVGSTTQSGEPENYDGGSSTWFYFVTTGNFGTTISLCGSDYDTKLYGFAASDCSDFNTYTELDYNDDYCGVQSQIEVCSSIGDTVRIKVDGYYGATGNFIITVTENYLEAGTGTELSVCSGDTLNLWTQLSGQSDNSGVWQYPNNPTAIISDSLAITANMPPSGNEFFYLIGNSCIVDTAVVTVNPVEPGNSGTAVSPFTSCNSDVYLPDGLEGVVEAGGTWTDDSNTGLLAGPNNNVFVAGSAPAGSYPFTYTVDNGVCPATSTSISVTITDCSGIGEIGNAVSLYPNPNDGDFLITSEESGENKVTITDISGKVIFNQVINLTASHPHNISLKNVEAGMYMVTISNANGNKVLNVIIK